MKAVYLQFLCYSSKVIKHPGSEIKIISYNDWLIIYIRFPGIFRKGYARCNSFFCRESRFDVLCIVQLVLHSQFMYWYYWFGDTIIRKTLKGYEVKNKCILIDMIRDYSKHSSKIDKYCTWPTYISHIWFIFPPPE